MKKTKTFLLSITGLSAIIAASIPLAACSKSKYTDGVEVSKKEWQEALAYLAACQNGSSWKTTDGDIVRTLHLGSDRIIQEYTEYYDIAFNDDIGSFSVIGNDETDVDIAKLTSIRKNNFYFVFGDETTSTQKEHKTTDIVPTSPIQELLTELFSAYGEFSDFKWDNETKTYNYSGMVQEQNPAIYVQSKIKLDSNKKITYINSHLVVVNSDDSSIFTDVILHPQYENVKPDVKQEYIDKANAWTVSLSGDTGETLTTDFAPFIDESTTEHRIIGLATIKSSGNYNRIVVTDESGTAIDDITGVYKNNKLLVKGVDYTMFSTNEIRFQDGPITPNDTIEFGFVFTGWSFEFLPEKLRFFIPMNISK